MSWIQVVGSIIGTLMGLGVFMGGIFYGYGKISEAKDKVRSEKDEVLRKDNEDLRKSRADQDRKIVELQQSVAHLQGQMKILSEKSTGYEDLIVRALEGFFVANPAVAKEFYDLSRKKK